MASLPRRTLGPGYFHVSNRTHQRLPMFVRPADYRAFLTVLTDALGRYPVDLIAFCILPTHWHLVLGPAGIPVLSRFARWVSATHAIRCRISRDRTKAAPLYQGRFSSVSLYRATDLVRACRYVERNALAAGLVRRAQDWPWGSLAQRLAGSTEVPIASAPFLTTAAWVAYVNGTEPRCTEGMEVDLWMQSRPPSPP